MSNEVFKKEFQPTSGGFEQLITKIETREKEEKISRKTWQGLASFLLVFYLGVPLLSLSKENLDMIYLPMEGEVLVAQKKAPEVQHPIDGVRYYQIAMKTD